MAKPNQIDYFHYFSFISDLKVDVHRKNSSESSDSLTEIPLSSFGAASSTQNYERRSTLKTKSKSEDASTSKAGETIKELRLTDEMDLMSRSEEKRDKFIETEGKGLHRVNASKKRLRNKLQRQTSLDSSGPDLKNFPVRRPVSSNHIHRQHHGSGFYHPNHLPSLAPEMYMEPHFSTKSELTIERFVGGKKTPMRKDSNSTMSAIQLPTNSGPSTSSSTARQRRYSSTTVKGQQPMPSGGSSVRRIKSTALDKCCPQPSYSNLSPHPNSVETINRPLRNPPHAILPPPSKSLVRNPHLNFFPKGASGSIEPVYPIAEIVDEKSLNESFILTSESEDGQDALSSNNDDSDDDDDDDLDFGIKESAKESKNMPSKAKSMSFTERRRQRRPTDSDNTNVPTKHSVELETERPRTQSTDSENEVNNNGSQSPLLDTRDRPTIFSSSSKKPECDTRETNEGPESKSNGTVPGSPDDEEGAVGGEIPLPLNVPANTKSEDSGCPSSDCEQASASSKDMLLSKSSKSKPPERNWHDFNMDANSISVDVTESGENVSSTMKASTSNESQDSKPAKETSKSLGAIPKASYSRYESNDEAKNRNHGDRDRGDESNAKSLSHASSANSLSGGSYNSLNSLNRNGLQIMQQTEDGWVLQNASPSNPYLVAQRGELPPLLPIYNTRTENVFPVPRKPYLYVHQQRQYHPKLRSGRNRMNSSIDTTASSRDEDDSSVAGAAGGSGSIGVGSGWDVLDMKISERLSTLFFPDLNETQTAGNQSTQRSAINRMAFADSMFWGHCNLPIEKKTQPKRYYKFPIKCLKREIKISMDRLQLLALFDRDYGTFQAIASILVGVCCSMLGAYVLQLDFYRDICAFIFCFVMAGSQYSLLKSVQPDASSSTHGDDARYSRPIYFCLCTSILIISHHLCGAVASDDTHLTLFGFPFTTQAFFCSIKELMSIILLLFPILFSFGLFAQVNTFLMYVLEQFDMHLFGGNAVCSLMSAFLGVFRSILACCMLYGFAFGGLSEPRSTQHVLFSCFCALLVATAYHLSRSASDCTYLWMIIKSSFAIHHDEDEELRKATKLSKIERNKANKKKTNSENNNVTKVGNNNGERQIEDNQTSTSNIFNDNNDGRKEFNGSVLANSVNDLDHKVISSPGSEEVLEVTELEDPLPGKLKNTVNSRLKNDFLVCTVIGVIIFSLHSSTVFTVLQPELNWILRSFVIVLGFLLHYLIPQMRKYLPWLCFAKPILKQKEYGMYESSEAAKVMWFESLFVYLSFVEKNILLPLVFISALTSDSAQIASKFGVTVGSAIVVLCGVKSESITSPQ